MNKFNIPNPSVRIVGSIASNSYSKNSDIDVHITSPNIKKGKQLEFNTALRKAIKKMKETKPSALKIGSHDIEIYFQANKYQDYMSVGCYDFYKKEWLVEPEMKDMTYNPYQDFYKADLNYLDEYIDDVRLLILEIYEKSKVLLSSDKNDEIEEIIHNELLKSLNKAFNIFDDLKSARSNYSAPKSKKDASKIRRNRGWKVADSAFKLIGNFGYLKILREYADIREDLISERINIYKASERIQTIIK